MFAKMYNAIAFKPFVQPVLWAYSSIRQVTWTLTSMPELSALSLYAMRRQLSGQAFATPFPPIFADWSISSCCRKSVMHGCRCDRPDLGTRDASNGCHPTRPKEQHWTYGAAWCSKWCVLSQIVSSEVLWNWDKSESAGSWPLQTHNCDYRTKQAAPWLGKGNTPHPRLQRNKLQRNFAVRCCFQTRFTITFEGTIVNFGPALIYIILYIYIRTT